MESIGNILKNERDKRGVSLAEAHEATKITLQNLAALEDDRFETFPNRVYARAFLRDYANYLGLDSGSLLERYEFEWGPKPDREAASRKSKAPLAIVAIVLIVLAVAAAYYALEVKKPGKPARPTTTALKTEKPKPKPKPAAEPVKTPVQPVNTSASTTGVDPAPAKELKLQVSGVGVSWMRVQVDQNPPTEFMVNASDVKSFTAKDKFIVRVGRPGDVTLHLNGKRLPQLGPPGTAITRQVDRTWLKPSTGPNATEQPQPATDPAPAAGNPQ